MIYEIRTYQIRPRTMDAVLERWLKGYEVRKRHSQIAAFFRTEIGPLNEVIQIWPYADLAERARIRALSVQDEGWPPELGDYILNQRVEIVHPFPFAPEWTPGADGPIYEMRQYTFRQDALPGIMAAWKEALPARLEFSRPALIGNVDMGPTVNSFIHLWPYSSVDERNEVRAAAAAGGQWPPKVTGDPYLAQANKILIPAPFSPAQ